MSCSETEYNLWRISLNRPLKRESYLCSGFSYHDNYKKKLPNIPFLRFRKYTTGKGEDKKNLIREDILHFFQPFTFS